MRRQGMEDKSPKRGRKLFQYFDIIRDDYNRMEDKSPMRGRKQWAYGLVQNVHVGMEDKSPSRGTET